MSRKTVRAPRFEFLPGPTRGDGPHQEPTQRSERSATPGRRDRRGNKRARGEECRGLLKVRLPKFSHHSSTEVAANEDATPRRREEPPVNEARKPASQGAGAQCAGTDSDSVRGDVFFFSQRSHSKATSEKEKVRLAVLRTTSKMLEENQLIRQRLASLSQAD